MTPLALALGCAFGPGEGFSEVAGATLRVALEPGAARDLGDGAVLTDQAYAVELDAMTLAVDALALQELQGGGSAEFDPSDPPAGYSNCHGGHCHADDGGLVDYADIEAELAGGVASFADIVSLSAGVDADLLAGRTVDLAAAEPSPHLPLADISRASLGVGALALSASVTGGELGDEALPLSLSLDYGGSITAGFELPVDRDLDPSITIAASLVIDGTLFDEIAFADRADEGALVIDDPDDPIAVAVLSALSAAALTVEARAE